MSPVLGSPCPVNMKLHQKRRQSAWQALRLTLEKVASDALTHRLVVSVLSCPLSFHSFLDTTPATRCLPLQKHRSCSKSHHGIASPRDSVLCYYVHSSQTSSSCCVVHLCHQQCEVLSHLPKPTVTYIKWSSFNYYLQAPHWPILK